MQAEGAQPRLDVRCRSDRSLRIVLVEMRHAENGAHSILRPVLDCSSVRTDTPVYRGECPIQHVGEDFRIQIGQLSWIAHFTKQNRDHLSHWM
jgi:hypothetical protein